MLDLSAASSARRWLVPAFFAAVLALGLLVFRDYGLSFDENQSRHNGMVALREVGLKLAPAWIRADRAFDSYTIPLAEYVDRDYGVAFEAPVCWLERGLDIDDWGGWPRTVHAATGLTALVLAAQMVRDHPFQNVYFNLLAGPRVDQRFDMEYWGLGFRQDLEYIVRHDARPSLTVAVRDNMAGPAELNRLLLPPAQRERLVLLPEPDDADYTGTADYFITNYRWHPEPYPYQTEIYQVRADGRRIHSVFQLRWPE